MIDIDSPIRSKTRPEIVRERAEDLDISRRALAEMNAGLGRPADEMLAEIRQILAENKTP